MPPMLLSPTQRLLQSLEIKQSTMKQADRTTAGATMATLEEPTCPEVRILCLSIPQRGRVLTRAYHRSVQITRGGVGTATGSERWALEASESVHLSGEKWPTSSPSCR